MGRAKQPVALIEAKGKTHLTRQIKEDRRESELTSLDTKIICPDYIIDDDARLEFIRYASLLDRVGVWSELHADELARYITAEQIFEATSKEVISALETGRFDDAGETQKMQDKAYRQAHTSASSLGLNITSFCKLVVPKASENNDDGGYNL
ncbi:MAG: P27 family phage terminase small subunit [Raoultibacter sp.]